MFQLKCNNEFYLNALISLFSQKNLDFYKQNYQKKFCVINFKVRSSNFVIKCNEKSKEINLPTDFGTLFEIVISLISDIGFSYQEIKYYPLKQVLVKQNKKSFLKNIHNIIFKNIFFNELPGIERIELYKKVWPFDKDIQINKLDTHLTNLKHHLSRDLDCDFKFITNAGKVMLITD
jgi:hypothetical protein